MEATATWHLAGTYLESCNCEAICPCRRIGGRQGGRSTYGECLGALSWQITDGAAGELDLAGLRVVITCRYSDDEERSPWTWTLYLDERATPEQQAALEDIYAGRAGGTPLEQFPWAFKPSDLVAVKPAAIEIDHTPGKGWFRIGRDVVLRVREVYPDQEPVTCVIPGHHRSGREIIADTLEVTAGPYNYELTGVCGYESDFEYAGP